MNSELMRKSVSISMAEQEKRMLKEGGDELNH